LTSKISSNAKHEPTYRRAAPVYNSDKIFSIDITFHINVKYHYKKNAVQHVAYLVKQKTLKLAR